MNEFDVYELRNRVLILFGRYDHGRPIFYAPFVLDQSNIQIDEHCGGCKVFLTTGLSAEYGKNTNQFPRVVAEAVAKENLCRLEVFQYAGTNVKELAFAFPFQSFENAYSMAAILATVIFQYNRGVLWVIEHKQEILEKAIANAGVVAALP